MLDVLFLASNRDYAPYNDLDFGNFCYSHIDRVFDLFKSNGFKIEINYSPKKHIPAKLYIYTNCVAITDFPWMKNYGKRVYCTHGAGIFKNYGWHPKEHKEHDIIMFASRGMQMKYEMCHPKLLRKKIHRVVGYSKYDKYFDQLKTGTARLRLIDKYNLVDDKPIILFAPTWGEEVNKYAQYLQHYPNVIFAPRVGFLDKSFSENITFDYDKSLEIAGCDVVITDISALGTEAGKLGKPIIQLCVATYPSTNMKHPTDLVIPGMEKYGPYIIGEQVFVSDPVSDFKFWDQKVDNALNSKSHAGRKMWSDLCIEFDDNNSSNRIFNFLKKYLK